MEHTFRIGEIADFFDIPASTLRFWEEKKIITPLKNPENNYREYRISDLITLSDTIFYKNLGIPLKQICDMSRTTPEEHRLLFEEKVSELERQQWELLAQVQKKHKTGAIISRFLLNAQENGVLYDFYKTYIEILP